VTLLRSANRAVKWFEETATEGLNATNLRIASFLRRCYTIKLHVSDFPTCHHLSYFKDDGSQKFPNFSHPLRPLVPRTCTITSMPSLSLSLIVSAISSQLDRLVQCLSVARCLCSCRSAAYQCLWSLASRRQHLSSSSSSSSCIIGNLCCSTNRHHAKNSNSNKLHIVIVC